MSPEAAADARPAPAPGPTGPRPRVIVMLGTDLRAPGGITAVVRSYDALGLFARWPLRYLPTFHRKTHWDRLATAAMALARFVPWLLRGEVALVHAHMAARASFWRKALFLALGRRAGARTVLHLHDGSFPAWVAARPAWQQRLVRHVLRRADRVVLLTPGWQTWLQGIEPAARTVVLPNPVRLPPAPGRPQPGRVLFLGRLWADKGIFELIEAAAEVRRRIPDVVLVCAGDGDAGAVRARAQACGVADCLQLPGWLDGAAKDAELAQAAVFVLPSHAEGLPVGVLEAMAWGVPVVGSDVGGMAEALGPDAGLLCPPGDVAALADALARVLSDPAAARAMGAAGRARAAQCFDGDRIVADLGALYASLGVVPRPAPAAPGAR